MDYDHANNLNFIEAKLININRDSSTIKCMLWKIRNHKPSNIKCNTIFSLFKRNGCWMRTMKHNTNKAIGKRKNHLKLENVDLTNEWAHVYISSSGWLFLFCYEAAKKYWMLLLLLFKCCIDTSPRPGLVIHTYMCLCNGNIYSNVRFLHFRKRKKQGTFEAFYKEKPTFETFN